MSQDRHGNPGMHVQVDERYQLYSRLKVGPGRTSGYRMSDESGLEGLRRSGDVVWENQRYGARYVVDRPSLVTSLSAGVPVVHLGQRQAVAAVTAAVAGACWYVVYLWCARELAEQRVVARRTGDTDARLRAWDATEPLSVADLTINTGELSPREAAERIHRYVLADAADVPQVRRSSASSS